MTADDFFLPFNRISRRIHRNTTLTLTGASPNEALNYLLTGAHGFQEHSGNDNLLRHILP